MSVLLAMVSAIAAVEVVPTFIWAVLWGDCLRAWMEAWDARVLQQERAASRLSRLMSADSHSWFVWGLV